MSILIVRESLFGNTAALARAIGDGLLAAGATDVRVVGPEEAPTTLDDDVQLLLVGGPTHAFSMTRASSRADAVRQGATGPATLGIREWIGSVAPRDDLPVVTFDTRVQVRLIPGSAAKSAVGALRRAGFRKVEQGETFWVQGAPGPVRDGELDRARAWGETLAQRVTGA